MKKGTGFSIRVDQSEQTHAAVRKTGPQSWEVLDLGTAREGTPLPRAFVQGVSQYPRASTWLIPNDLAQVGVLPLPQLKGKELTRAVLGWVAREEKANVDSFAVSWHALPRSETAKKYDRQQVFALYAEHKEIDVQLAGTTAQTAPPGRMLPPFMILDQFFRHTHPEGFPDGTWNLVYLGRHENFLVVGRQDCPLLTRALPFDLSEGHESDQYLDQLVTEIDRSGFYVRQTENSPEVAKIIVAGDPQLAARLVANLKNRTETPSETWDLAPYFSWGKREVSSESFIPLMAAALSLEPTPYNLLPEPKRSLLGPKARHRLLVATGSAAVALLPVILVGSTLTAKVQEGYLRKARERLDIARLDAQDAAEAYKKQRLQLTRQDYLTSFAASRPDLEAVLLEIGAMAPPEVRFRDLQITEDDLGKTRLILMGESGAPTSGQAQSAFIAFQKALDQAPFLETYMEPVRLEIDNDAHGTSDRPHTIFQLKYILVTDQSRES